MAGGSLLLLLDDIASLLDDVSAMTKVAATKTAGVVGDDLAVNAEQVAGVVPDRELSVVWAVAKGSLLNKAILVPLALGISWVLPPLVTLLLMVGGAFLCFEGFEKLAHPFLHRSELEQEAEDLADAALDPLVDLRDFEKAKIRGAIRTDFILSAEIIVISLGTMVGQPVLYRALALSVVALVMTVFVYGLVAAIVKLDDLGIWLLKQRSRGFQRLGRGLIFLAPKLMKGLAVAGTVAMFLVGGGIIVHGLSHFAWAHELFERHEAFALVRNLFVGVVIGGLVYLALRAVDAFRGQRSA